MKLTRQSIDWPGFHSNRTVRGMPAETKGVYLLFMGEMWTNEGWLLDDDRHIAHRLGMDVRTWRKHRRFIEPELDHINVTAVGMTLQQTRLSREYAHTLELVDKKRAQTAPARARLRAKSKQAPSVTESQPPRATKTVTAPVTKPETEQVTKSATAGEAEKEEALPSNRQSLLPSAPSLRTMGEAAKPNGKATAAAPVASPGLEDRSAPEPDEEITPTPALLRSQLVKSKPTGLMAALQSMIEDEDEDDEDKQT